MSSPAKLLGSADGTQTVTVFLDAAVPSEGTLQVVHASVGLPNGASGHGQYVDNATDTGGGTWDPGGTARPEIGLARGTAGSYPNDNSLLVGSFARACTAADLAAGDSITFHYANTPPVYAAVALVVYLPTSFEAVGQSSISGDSAPVYGNGLAYPDMVDAGSTEVTAQALDWDGSDPFLDQPDPDADAYMVAALGAYPAQAGFVPAAGQLLGERATGDCSVACVVVPSVAAHVPTDPGGAWPAPADALAGNYQLLVAIPLPAGTFAPAAYAAGVVLRR